MDNKLHHNILEQNVPTLASHTGGGAWLKCYKNGLSLLECACT